MAKTVGRGRPLKLKNAGSARSSDGDYCQACMRTYSTKSFAQGSMALALAGVDGLLITRGRRAEIWGACSATTRRRAPRVLGKSVAASAPHPQNFSTATGIAPFMRKKPLLFCSGLSDTGVTARACDTASHAFSMSHVQSAGGTDYQGVISKTLGRTPVSSSSFQGHVPGRQCHLRLDL